MAQCDNDGGLGVAGFDGQTVIAAWQATWQDQPSAFQRLVVQQARREPFEFTECDTSAALAAIFQRQTPCYRRRGRGRQNQFHRGLLAVGANDRDRRQWAQPFGAFQLFDRGSGLGLIGGGQPHGRPQGALCIRARNDNVAPYVAETWLDAVLLGQPVERSLGWFPQRPAHRPGAER